MANEAILHQLQIAVNLLCHTSIDIIDEHRFFTKNYHNQLLVHKFGIPENESSSFDMLITDAHNISVKGHLHT